MTLSILETSLKRQRSHDILAFLPKTDVHNYSSVTGMTGDILLPPPPAPRVGVLPDNSVLWARNNTQICLYCKRVLISDN